MFRFAKNLTPDPTPKIYDSASILALVSVLKERGDDLRNADIKCADDIRRIKDNCNIEKDVLREKLAQAETRRIDALNLAEMRRVDAVLSEQKVAMASANEKNYQAIDSLRTEATATHKAISDSIRALEQNQYRTGGRDLQRQENRQQGQWVIGLIIGTFLLIAQIIVRVLMR